MAKAYIEREAYYRQIDNLSKGKHGVYCAAINDCMNALDEQPAADVVEVRHGYWIPSPDDIYPLRCSECNMPAPFAVGEDNFGNVGFYRYPSSYCHECGAKMGGERKTD